jgi:hypothetical protein
MAMHATSARALPPGFAAACTAAVCLVAYAAAGAQPPARGASAPVSAVQVAAAALPTSGGGAAAPDPRLAPDAVVGIVLDALAHTGPGGGAADPRPIALVYAFASPANRAAVGTVDRFTDLVRDDAYRPLLGHRRAARGALVVAGDHATQRVLVTTADGARVAYTFTLARQAEGAFRGCWMTDGVTREAPSRLAAPQSA